MLESLSKYIVYRQFVIIIRYTHFFSHFEIAIPITNVWIWMEVEFVLPMNFAQSYRRIFIAKLYENLELTIL